MVRIGTGREGKGREGKGNRNGEKRGEQGKKGTYDHFVARGLDQISWKSWRLDWEILRRVRLGVSIFGKIV
jgi:hypothetical protein